MPSKIVIDDSYETNLAEEYLLTTNNTLFVLKKYPEGGKPKIYIKANHPSSAECGDLLNKKIKDLKIQAEKLAINCDKSKNAVLRKAIWEFYHDSLSLLEREIEISGDGLKDIWTKISRYMPIYCLFQSDRSNNDKDKEAQDPLKEAVKLILADPKIQITLQQVADIVTQKLREVTNDTLEKLREMNEDIASKLSPQIPSTSELKWADVFKNVAIAADNDIPINKHGSGVKRMILLNFFRAEAEKVRGNNEKANIIYAIEEPETSQHLKHQLILVDALKKLSQQGHAQVLITTHGAHIVRYLNFSDLRLVYIDNNGHKCVGDVVPTHLPYPSLNEVNLIAFEEFSEEYHNELYGYIDLEGWLADYRSDMPKQTYIKLKNNGQVEVQQVCLTDYVRHQIHHPENTNNTHYTVEELRKSINMMRNFIAMKKGGCV